MKNISLSPQFKRQTTKAILSIILFVLTYILMLAFAVGLMALCLYGGIMMIVSRPMFITLALGIGLASLGVLVLVFLLKFLAKSHKVDRSHLIELHQADEPQLFALIEEIVKEVGTTFPKKVYLSSEVNASVFYDSSFLSMFLPIKKNLQLGLGLVNTVSQTELKAILSHEFGHFSQNTMKVGSYVYHVNQVIYNLLFENETYDTLLQKWGNASWYFSLFAIVAQKLIEGIKWVLRQVYGIVNKSYMALSREMEFHADEIAAHVTGYEPLANSLLRFSLADYSFNSVISFYENRISANQKPDNLFKGHLFVTNFYAEDSGIDIKNNLPSISGNENNKFNKSKLVVKDQWASHPSTEERIASLEKTGLNQTDFNHEPANLLFANIEKLQQEFTQRIFNEGYYTAEPSVMPFEEFQSDFIQDHKSNTFPKIYNSYYDTKNPLFFDIQNITKDSTPINPEDLFSDNKVEEVYTAISLKNDIDSLKQISDKTYGVKTFDYDGRKYSKKDCKNLIAKLEIELAVVNEKIRANDIDIFKYFLNQEQKSTLEPLLENLYTRFFTLDKEYEANYEVYIQLSNELQFVNYNTPFEQIRANFIKIEPLEERLKKGIKELMEKQEYQSEISNEVKEKFDLYLSKSWQYFGNEIYFDENLTILYDAMNQYANILSRGYFLLKQRLLTYQVGLMDTTN